MPSGYPLPWDPQKAADEADYHDVLWDPFVAEFPELLPDHEDDVIDFLTGVAIALRYQQEGGDALDIGSLLQFYAEEWFPDIDQFRLAKVAQSAQVPVHVVLQHHLDRAGTRSLSLGEVGP